MRCCPRLLKAVFTLFFFCAFLCRGLYAEEITLRLKDGVVLKGWALSEDEYGYSLAMGDSGGLVVRKTDVVSIDKKEERRPSSLATGESSGTCGGDYLEYALARSNVAAMLFRFLHHLRRDKDMLLAVLSDPQLEDMVMRQDIAGLQKNEKFSKILEYPAVRGTVLPVHLLDGTVKLLEITYILMRDQEMMELLSDANLLLAVCGLDSGLKLSLENKGKFSKFMNHPAVKKFIDTEVATWGE